jgi:hypothetical protein
MPLFDDAALRRQAMLQQMDPPAQVEQAESGAGIGPGPYAALFAGQGADLATTLMAMRKPGAREMNPLGVGGVVASKMAMMALMPFLMRKFAKQGNGTAAKALGYGIGAAGAVPAVWNARQMAK